MEQKNSMVKVGDKIRALSVDGWGAFKPGDIIEVIAVYTEGIIGYNGERKAYVTASDKWELISSLPASTTTEKSIIDESNALTNAIDDAIFYFGYNPVKPKAKPVEVLGALIHILVDKGVLSSKDAERILVATND